MARTDQPPAEIVLGTASIRPATCEVVAATRRYVLEPQVMRVLAVLANGAGSVIPRDVLIDQCWDGRSISEDAINRVISRIRKLAADTGAFELQTQRKVGYRLVASLAAEPADTPPTEVRKVAWPWAMAGVLALLVAGLAAWLLLPGSRATDGTHSLMIQLAAGGPADRPRVQAFTAELRQSFGRIRGLEVRDRAAGTPVDLILEGSLGTSADSPILLMLKDGRDGSMIWSGRFAQAPALLPAQQRATAASVRYVAVWLSDRNGGRAAAREPDRPDVTQLITEGMRAWQIANEERQRRDMAAAGRHFAKASAKADAALALDPESAGALMLRFQVDQIPTYPRPGESEPAFRQRMQRADQMLTRALSADPDDAAVLVAAAQDYNRASDWSSAGALLRRAVTLDPASPDANSWYGFHLALVGRCREGLRFAQTAVELDPGFSWRKRAIPRLLQCAGETGQAMEHYRRLLREDPANSSLAYEAYLVALSSGPGDLQRLAVFMRTDLWHGRAPPLITATIDRADAAAAALAGRRGALERRIDQDFDAALGNSTPVSAGTQGDTMFALAYEYAAIGATDKALAALTRAHDAGSTYLPWALPFGSREFPGRVRSDPRYRALWRTSSYWLDLMRSRETARTSGKKA